MLYHVSQSNVGPRTWPHCGPGLMVRMVLMIRMGLIMGLMVISVPGCPPGPRPGSAAARLAPALAQSVTLRLVMVTRVTRVTLGARQQRSPGQGAGGYGAQENQRNGEDCLKNSISVTNPK